MAEDYPTIIFSYEVLTALSLRLADHAEDLAATLEFEPIVIDLKWAARACSNFATLQFQVREIAAGLLERPSLAIHRDLAAALYEASQGGR